MDSKDITEWIAYYNLEPFGDERDDVRQAITSNVIANVFDTKRHNIDEFIPKFRKRKIEKPISDDEIRAKIRVHNKLLKKAKKRK